jgi:hypothetical protein
MSSRRSQRRTKIDTQASDLFAGPSTRIPDWRPGRITHATCLRHQHDLTYALRWTITAAL